MAWGFRVRFHCAGAALVLAAVATLAASAIVVFAFDSLPSNALVAAYSYDEGASTMAADRSVNNNTGTLSGASWTAACKFGNCLSYNGTSNFVESPDIDALTPGVGATFEAWVFLNSAPAETASIFNKWSQTNNDEYLVGISPGRTLYFAWHTTGGSTWRTASFNEAFSTGTIPLNTLTHIAVVRSGPLLTFYINGVLNTSLTVMDTNPFRNGGNSLRVGGQGRGTKSTKNRFFKGVIDEARMYNRALTLGEIASDMGTAISLDSTAPVLSAVSASGLTPVAATISWTTNEASDSQVEYGLTTAYGSTTPLNASLVTAHTAALSGLADTTPYHYRVRSRDAAGNLAVSGDFTFTTLDGAAPAVAITAPGAGASLSGTVSVTATATDNAGVAGVQFKVDGALLGAEDTTSPYSVSWDTTTAAAGSHSLTAVARDAAGNVTTSAVVVVTIDNIPPNTLVAAYSYNEGGGTTAADTSVNNNTSTVSDTAWTASCKFDNCLSFNGTSSFVESPDISALTPGVDATFEAWVFLNSTPTETASVFNKWSQTIDDEYLVGISPGRALYFAWHTTGGNTWPSASFNHAFSTGTIPLNTLTHVAIVRSGSLLTFYINGVLNTSISVMDANPFRNGVNTLRVGGQSRGLANRFFNGVIDETRMYNRALTEAEIASDMNTVISPDSTAPVLSAISASGVTTVAATISWTTNEASDTQVNYGPTIAYGNTSPLVGTLLTSHVAILTGLTPNTPYHYQVRSRDAAGNLAQSGDFMFTTLALDLTAPAIALTAPAANATVSGLITVSANATDNVGVAGVQFRLDGAALGAEDTASPYLVSWDTTAAANGSHTLTAVARDAAGNQTTASAVTVTVANDVTPPVISLVIASSVTGSGATINWTTDETSDTQVEYGPTTAYGSTTTLNASLVTAHTAGLTGLADATLYHYRVRSRDAAGNLAVSGDFAFTTLDGTAPSVSISAPAGGATVSGTISVTATASDNVGVVGVQFKLDGAVLGAEDTTSPYSVSWNTTTNGSHSLTAVARDAAGNQTTATAVTVTIANDVIPPAISLVTASSITASAATINWTTDETSDTQVEYGPTTAYGSTTTLNASLVTAHSQTVIGLPDGTLNHYRVHSRDAAGNLATSGDFTFTTLDGTAPSVSISAPAGGATVSGTISVTATASDNVGMVGVQFKLDGAVLGAEDTTSPYSVSWNTTTATNGSHSLTAVARDASANVTTSAVVALTVDNIPSNTLIEAYSYNEGGGTTAADTSVNNNTGTVSGTAWTASCKFGNCLSFNGTSSFVESPDIGALTPGVDATFEAWVFLNSAPTETASIFNKWNQTTDDEYMFGISPSRTLYLAWHTTGGNTWPTASFNQAFGTGTIPLNTLTHVAVVRSGPVLTFYINGVLDTSLTVMDANPFRNGVNTLRVGGQGRGSANRFFNGVIDEARIYNRALTAAEIVSDMNTVIGPDSTPPVISAISVSGLTSLAATINWITNEASDTQVHYGPTIAYGSTSPLMSTLLTTHVAFLTGLTPNALYHYQVRSRDAAGNLAQSGDLTFTTLPIDLTPPTVSLTAPAANATVSGLITVSANATDNVGVVGVQFKLDGVNLGLEDALAPYTLLWDTTTTSSGPHTLTAVAFDLAGNQATSSPIAVTVSNDSQLTLAWDANTEANLAGYKLYLGDSSGVYTSSIDVGNVTTVTVTGLQSGHLYYFAVTAGDTDSLESGFSNEVSGTAP